MGAGGGEAVEVSGVWADEVLDEEGEERLWTWESGEGKMSQFEVRNEDAEKKLKEIGEGLRASMPKGFGFVLLIASFGEGGAMFYTANCDRGDVCNMVREFISKHEPN